MGPTPEQILAFRLAGHHLDRRLRGAGAMAAAAGACGIQASTPGGPALALAARVEGVTPDAVDRALEDELVRLWSIRGSTQIVPAEDRAVFSVGVRPSDDEGWRGVVSGIAPRLERLGWTPADAVAITAQEAKAALADGPLTFVDLHAALRERMPEDLLPWCRGCQSHHVWSTQLRAVGLLGEVVFTGTPDEGRVLVRVDPPDADAEAARAELVRRFLRCFGPAKHGPFAAWAGISNAQAKTSFGLIADELEPVESLGSILAEDRPRLDDPPAAEGVRVLPPDDPYLAQRDRELLVPDAAVRKRLFPAIARPGTVLVDGRLAALWRARKQGKRLKIAVDPVGTVRKRARGDVEAAMAEVAPFRGCESAEVGWA